MPAPPPVPSHRRRAWYRPRIGLRGVMLLVALVALPLGWAVTTIREQRGAIAAVRAARGRVQFDWESEEIPPGPDGVPTFRNRTGPAAPAWLRRWLGDELFQQVEVVEVWPDPGTDVLRAVARFDRLARLNVEARYASVARFDRLRHQTRLKQLELSEPGVTDASLVGVARLDSLEDLVLYRTRITDEGLAALARLPRLAVLQINDCPLLSDDGVARLVAGLPQLRVLDLGGARVESPARTLRALAAHHPDLRSLDLTALPVTDADLAPVASLTRLEFLSLDGTAVTDAGLAHLRPLRHLAHLGLAARGVTDAGLPPLRALPALRELDLATARITDAGLTALAGLPLRRLNLHESLVTDAGLTTLARMTRLESLCLSGLPQVTDAGLAQLQGLPKLDHLVLQGPRITPAGVAALRRVLPGIYVDIDF